MKITYRPIAGIVAIPSECIFGEVLAGTQTTRSVILALAVPAAEHDIAIECAPSDLLTAKVVRTRGRICDVAIGLAVPDNYRPATFEGTVRFACAMATESKVEMRVKARINGTMQHVSEH